MNSKVKPDSAPKNGRHSKASIGSALFTAFAAASMLPLMAGNALAADTTIWTKASEIMKDVYKACASMTRLADRYGAKRLEDACERLLSFTSVPTIRTLSTILKNGQDRLAAPETTRSDTKPVQHGITRGAAYFRKGGATE